MVGTIVLEPNLSDEQLIKLHQSYKEEEVIKKEQLKRKHGERYREIQAFINSERKNIFNQIKSQRRDG